METGKKGPLPGFFYLYRNTWFSLNSYHSLWHFKQTNAGLVKLNKNKALGEFGKQDMKPHCLSVCSQTLFWCVSEWDTCTGRNTFTGVCACNGERTENVKWKRVDLFAVEWGAKQEICIKKGVFLTSSEQSRGRKLLNLTMLLSDVNLRIWLQVESSNNTSSPLVLKYVSTCVSAHDRQV